MRRQYLVNYHLHLAVRAPALEPGSVVMLDLTPDQERQLIGKSLTPLADPAELAEQPAKTTTKTPAKRKRRATASKP